MRDWFTRSDHIWAVVSDDELASFRMWPERGLAVVAATIAEVTRELGPGAHILWTLENKDNRGLDDFEAEAVFGDWLDIEVIAQVEKGRPVSQLLIAGAIREEYVGLSFRLEDSPSISESMGLWRLARSRMPVVLFIGHDRAVRSRLSVLALRHLIRRHRWTIGLWVPAHRTTAALQNLEGEVEPLRSLAGDAYVPIVRFENPVPVADTSRLLARMADARLVCDSSLTGYIHPRRSPAAPIATSYLNGGAYIPQLFDLRSPATTPHSAAIELVATRIGDESLEETWRRRCGRDDQRLIQRLDFSRMERYFRECDASLELIQAYDEYRVYNWPPPDRSPRVTLLDGGLLGNERVARVVGEVGAFLLTSSERWRCLDGFELLAASRHEANCRSMQSADVLRTQADAHEYLATVATERPLRQDYEDFIQFLPDRLGVVLEIGSGYGQLARALLSRASEYVCLDVSRQAFAELPLDVGMCGVVADAHFLPFDQATFDSIIANNVLEHLYDPVAGLKELRRVLKPHGSIFALIPMDLLNPSREIRTHRWKLDLASVESALAMSDLKLGRHAILNLYELGVRGSFPTCNGFVLKIEAVRCEMPLRTNSACHDASEAPICDIVGS